MARYAFVLALALLVVGCGYDPEDPIYDTAGNPDGFPQLALSMIDDIEAGNLGSYDVILERFAELYTQHSELLDNEPWKDVIDRLGRKLRFRADSALESGVNGYSEAAAGYMLASFALPDDAKLVQTARLFQAWLKTSSETELTQPFDGAGTPSLADRLRLLRHFELADSLHRRFSQVYLRPSLFVVGDDVQPLAPGTVRELPAADQALLAYAGLVGTPPDSKMASFEDPAIDLITARLVSLRPDWYRLELYFIPKSAVAKDLTVAVRVVTDHEQDSMPAAGALNFVPFDFAPQLPTSRWPAGHVQVLAKELYFTEELGEIKVGLYGRAGDETALVRISGSDALFVSLLAEEISAD